MTNWGLECCDIRSGKIFGCCNGCFIGKLGQCVVQADQDYIQLPRPSVVLVTRLSDHERLNATLRHSVLPGNFNGERITIAFNAVM